MEWGGVEWGGVEWVSTGAPPKGHAASRRVDTLPAPGRRRRATRACGTRPRSSPVEGRTFDVTRDRQIEARLPHERTWATTASTQSSKSFSVTIFLGLTAFLESVDAAQDSSLATSFFFTSYISAHLLNSAVVCLLPLPPLSAHSITMAFRRFTKLSYFCVCCQKSSADTINDAKMSTKITLLLGSCRM